MYTHTIKNISFVFLIFATSVSFGLSYGSGNQNTYLIHGLTLVKPNFLIGDWFAYNTLHYHDQFSNIIVLINCLNFPIDISLTVIEVVLRIIAFVTIYKIITLLIKEFSFIAFIMILSLVVLERTASVAGTYIFSTMLLPSSFGSVFTLIGFLFFLRGRYFLSGINIAFAGYMHTNFLVIGFVYFGLAHLILGFKDFIGRIFSQFSFMTIILSMKLPLLLGMLMSENRETAAYILQFIRSPHHYVPNFYLFDFMKFSGWSILGLCGLYIIQVESVIKKRLIALHGALLFVLVCSTLLTTIVFSPIVSSLFFWRMAPFSVILSQIIFFSAIFDFFRDPRLLISDNKIIHAVSIVGFSLIMYWYLCEYGLVSSRTLFLISIFFLSCILIALSFFTIKVNNIRFIKYLIEIICLMLYFTIITYDFTRWFYSRSTLLGGFPPKAQSDLYQWVKTTKPETIFLVPPDLQNFRLHGERPIVVDWKSTPIDPNGLLEWHSRIQDIAGLRDVKSLKDVYNGFCNLDENNLVYLKRKYNISYFISYANKKALLYNFPIVFMNEDFLVFSLSPLYDEL